MFEKKSRIDEVLASVEMRLHVMSDRIHNLEHENRALRAHLGLDIEYAPSKYTLRETRPKKD